MKTSTPTLQRRSAAAKLLGLAAAFSGALPPGLARAHPDAHADPGTASGRERLALLQAARQALSQGQSRVALRQLEAAALMSHDADTEMLMVLAMLQAGEFLNALNFASHTAGAHKDEPEALALYAWLQALSGQASYAARIVATGLQRLPDEPHLRALQPLIQQLLDRSWTDARTPRPGPQAFGAPLPDDAQALGSGLLLNGGRLALLALDLRLALPDPSRPLWLRNGLGQTQAARPSPRPDTGLAALGLCLLELAAPITLPSSLPPLHLAPRDAFAGSPAAALLYPPQTGNGSAWPAMHLGFVGRLGHTPGPQGLDIALPTAAGGGPVFDSSGRCIGFARPGQAASPQLLPLSSLLPALPTQTQAEAGPRPTDELYELALPLTLQVFGAQKTS